MQVVTGSQDRHLRVIDPRSILSHSCDNVCAASLAAVINFCAILRPFPAPPNPSTPAPYYLPAHPQPFCVSSRAKVGIQLEKSRAVQKCANFVESGKCCQIDFFSTCIYSYYSQKSVSI